MSIIADIKRAKAEFEHHVATHKCRHATVAEADGQEWCRERIDLWVKYMVTAHFWGLSPDDEIRQRRHYERNVGRAAL